jgi:protocatechuate 3,4-dioxygenase alpha subunit
MPRTPSQTVGPFFSIGMSWQAGPFVVPEGMRGAIWIRGVVLDGAGTPVPDALVETWQADGDGRFDRAGFRGFGRCPTDEEGRYGILTVKPGAVRDQDGTGQAPHVAVGVFARGLLTHLHTRLYFGDEEVANAIDPVLTSVGDPGARAALVAEPIHDGYRFDIRLQGDRETAFFAI